MDFKEKYTKIYAQGGCKYNKSPRENNAKDVLAGFYEGEKDYFYRLALRRVQIVLEHYKGGQCLDVCAGNGQYMAMLAPSVEKITGIDFIKEACDAANKFFEESKMENATCIEGDATQLPFENATFDLTYSFSSLYDIPDFEKAIVEMARVTKKDGVVILDLATNKSINTVISRYYSSASGFPQISCLSDKEIYSLLEKNNLQSIESINFQMFPYWGTHPSVLKLFCGKRMNHIMAKRINGKMLDEIVSNMPLIRKYAFRRILVCEKK